MQWSFDPTNVVTTVLATLAVLVPVLKKFFPAAGNAMEKAIPTVKVAVEDAVQFVAHLAQSPFFAGKFSAAELQAHHVVDQLQSLTAVKEAQTILLGVGKFYAGLTDQEKTKAEVLLKLTLSAVGINLSEAEIKAVFDEADKAIAALKQNDFFKASFPEEPAPQQTA